MKQAPPMSELSAQNPEFEISLVLKGVKEKVSVTPEETSDGATYYNCKLHKEQLTQIRETTTGEWEQIWGKLDPATVNLIGKTIKDHL